jgi:hypothetical protein
MKDGQTIGQWLNWDFEANGDLEIRDKNGRQLYIQYSNGFWEKREFDSNRYRILTYREDCSGFWEKCEYDSQGNKVYCENSNGKIIDNRTPEVIEHNGRKYQLIP